jgi:hypothetical protein
MTAALAASGPAAWCEALSARRAPRVIPAELVPWYDGVAHMQSMPPPTGFSPARWRRACLDAAGLLDTHGAELVALGWTATDVFGLHSDAPGAAVRCYGLAVLLDGGSVTDLTAEGAAIVRPSGAALSSLRGIGLPVVPAWELDGSRGSYSALAPPQDCSVACAAPSAPCVRGRTI